MRNKKKLTALVLAAVLGMTSISLPTEIVQAEEAVQEYVVYGEGASEVAIENYSEEDVSATTERISKS
ncbi:MAG: hypothetical protein J6A75_06980 [Lachnospiraceae bacterium]|nr:hypothetical protein [Lachnospiraceae bacterium]